MGGLLGGLPDGNQGNDWLKRDGGFEEKREKKGSIPYDYCTREWCIGKTEAQFIYSDGESYETFDKCSAGYDESQENKVLDALTDPEKNDGKECCADVAGDDDDEFMNCFTDVSTCIDDGGDAQECCDIYTGGSPDDDTDKTYTPDDEDEPDYSAGGAKTRPPSSEPGTRGDPHFKTWNGDIYDFHGICDLVLLNNQGYEGGLGMDIHVRTKKTKSWSSVSAMAIRIGDETFEIMAGFTDDRIWLHKLELQDDKYTLLKNKDLSISGYTIGFENTSSQQRTYVINLGEDGERITVASWKGMLRVDVDVGDDKSSLNKNYAGSVGLMGTFPEGKKFARDNRTDLSGDLNAFGQEWQVLPGDGNLLHFDESALQAPSKCSIPAKVDLRRRLGESKISVEIAEEACAGVANEDDFNLCVFDVMATGDKDLAGAY